MSLHRSVFVSCVWYKIGINRSCHCAAACRLSEKSVKERKAKVARLQKAAQEMEADNAHLLKVSSSAHGVILMRAVLEKDMFQRCCPCV